MLTKEQILAADDLPRETVSVPEWGGDVTLQRLTAAEWNKWQVINFAGQETMVEGDFEKSMDAMTALIIPSLVGDDGAPLFEDTKENRVALAGKSMAALRVVFDKALEVNAGTAEVQEDAEKNSEAGEDEDLSSSSPGS